MDIISFSYRDLFLSYSIFALSRIIFNDATLPLALFNDPSLGTTLTLAKRSPSLTLSPSSTNSSWIIPEIWGLISTSSSGITLPVTTVFSSTVSIKGDSVSIEESGLSKREWNELMEAFDLRDKLI